MENCSSLLDEVGEIVRGVVGAILDSSFYSSKKVSHAHIFSPDPSFTKIAARPTLTQFPFQVNDWIHTILDACLRELVALNRPSKYLLSCVLSQKNGAGFRSVASQYWDGRSDFTCAVPWENDHIHCLVTIHAVALHLTGHASSGHSAGATGAGAVACLQGQDKTGTDHPHRKKQEAGVIVQIAAGVGEDKES